MAPAAQNRTAHRQAAHRRNGRRQGRQRHQTDDDRRATADHLGRRFDFCRRVQPAAADVASSSNLALTRRFFPTFGFSTWPDGSVKLTRTLQARSRGRDRLGRLGPGATRSSPARGDAGDAGTRNCGPDTSSAACPSRSRRRIERRSEVGATGFEPATFRPPAERIPASMCLGASVVSYVSRAVDDLDS